MVVGWAMNGLVTMRMRGSIGEYGGDSLVRRCEGYRSESFSIDTIAVCVYFTVSLPVSRYLGVSVA